MKLVHFSNVFLFCSGNWTGDRASARAYLCPHQGLLQEDSVLLDVLQTKQGAVSVGNILPYCCESAALHVMQETSLYRRDALLAVHTMI